VSKYDQRSLQARRELIKLFGRDSEFAVVISRPDKRPHNFPQEFRQIADKAATATPPMLCFDRDCKAEVRAPDTFLMIRTNKKAPPIMAVVCAACAEKSNDEILGVVRREFAPTFDKASIVNAAASGVHFEAVTRRIVHGIGMAFPLDEPDIPDVALLFGELLEQQKLTRFDAYFRGASNCFEIVNQLYLDFKTLGLENAFTYKMGFSSRMKSDGEPMGH